MPHILLGSNVYRGLVYNAFHEICETPEEKNISISIDIKLRLGTYLELGPAIAVTNNWNHQLRSTWRLRCNRVVGQLPDCAPVQSGVWNDDRPLLSQQVYGDSSEGTLCQTIWELLSHYKLHVNNQLMIVGFVARWRNKTVNIQETYDSEKLSRELIEFKDLCNVYF